VFHQTDRQFAFLYKHSFHSNVQTRINLSVVITFCIDITFVSQQFITQDTDLKRRFQVSWCEIINYYNYLKYMSYLAEHQVHFGRCRSHFTHVIRPVYMWTSRSSAIVVSPTPWRHKYVTSIRHNLTRETIRSYAPFYPRYSSGIYVNSSAMYDEGGQNLKLSRVSVKF
jgi:hypothetical protein